MSTRTQMVTEHDATVDHDLHFLPLSLIHI